MDHALGVNSGPVTILVVAGWRNSPGPHGLTFLQSRRRGFNLAVQHSMVTIRSTIPGARTMNLQHVRGADHKCYSGHDLGNQDAAGETRYLPYAPGYFDQKPE